MAFCAVSTVQGYLIATLYAILRHFWPHPSAALVPRSGLHVEVVTTELHAFQSLYDEELSRLPNVQRLISTLVMKHVITDCPLPFA